MHRAATLAVAGCLALLLAAPSSAALGKHLIASGFTSPVYATVAPGHPHDIFVVEQPGRIIRLHDGTKSVFLDIRGRVGDGGTEQGLLSVAFHPRYRTNHRFFVYFTNTAGNLRIVQFRANSTGTRGRPATAHTRIRVSHPTFANHNGGQLQFGPNGRLYAATGDGGSGGDPPNNAQNMRSRLGKLLVLNVDKRDARARIAALGLRNPWRFSFDSKTGVMWIGDVGQDSYEEIDRFHPGNSFRENYGWSRWEGNQIYNGSRSLTAGRYVRPIHVFAHGSQYCSVSGGYMVRGVVLGHGRYFFGDYCSGTIWSFRYAHGRKSGLRRHGFSVPSLSSFGLDGRGRLLMVSRGGELFRLVRGSGPGPARGPSARS